MSKVKGDCEHPQCPLQKRPAASNLASISRDELASAYVRQSQSDWAVYNLLAARPDVNPCQRLHYLQMATEKFAKALRLRFTQVSISRVETGHTGFADIISLYFTNASTVQWRYRGRDAQRENIIRFGKRMAREIEKLAPSVDRDASPVNAEYPWIEDGQLVVPGDYSFPNLVPLDTTEGRAFLVLIEEAIQNFEQIEMINTRQTRSQSEQSEPMQGGLENSATQSREQISAQSG